MNIYPLVELLAPGKFRTGTELGAYLKISRTAIWKQINQLRELGLELEVNKQLGYRLTKPLELLNKDFINSYLIENLSRIKLEKINSIDSTSLEVKRQLNQSDVPVVVIAEMQTAGKGRRGKSWASPFAKNLALSFGCKLDADLSKLQGLSLAIAVELDECLQEFGNINLGFKWPNDIYLNNKKVAGILVEVSGDFSGPFNLIIGIGLNVFKSSAYTNISQPFAFLEDVLPKISRSLLAAKLAVRLEKLISKFITTGFFAWQDRWNKKHIWASKKAMLISSDDTKVSVILDSVNSFGELLVINSKGKQEIINSGEVSLRLEDDY